jgi:hypothetical protein
MSAGRHIWLIARKSLTAIVVVCAVLISLPLMLLVAFDLSGTGVWYGDMAGRNATREEVIAAARACGAEVIDVLERGLILDVGWDLQYRSNEANLGQKLTCYSAALQRIDARAGATNN